MRREASCLFLFKHIILILLVEVGITPESHLTRQIVLYICLHLILAVWLVACLGIEAPRVSVDFTTEGAIRVTCRVEGEEGGRIHLTLQEAGGV